MDCAFTLPDRFCNRLHEAIVNHLHPDLFPIDYIPSSPDLEHLLQVAVWASLQTDEGRRVAFTMSLRHQASPSSVMLLRDSIPLVYNDLAKFSMATDPSQSAIHVGPDNGKFRIFGIDTLLGTAAAVSIEVRGPARVAVKAASATIAIISNGDANLIDLGMYNGFLKVDPTTLSQSTQEHEHNRRLHQLALSMYAHGHGGTLLIQSPGAERSSSIKDHYLLARGFNGLPEVELDINTALGTFHRAETASDVRSACFKLQTDKLRLDRYIAAVGKTTAVDGAAIICDDGTLLGFGAKIALNNTPKVFRRLPIVDSDWQEVELVAFGGTRHQSAAQFVADARGNRAIVASQDGRLSILRHRSHEAVECLQHAEWLI